MSAIIEPASATWWVSDRWAYKAALTLAANREDRNLTITRRYPAEPGKPRLVEYIELTLDQLAEVEAALLNARLWLERATKQADEPKAAEEVAQDEPQPLVCVRCEHPWHQGAFCDVCDCDDTPRCYRCNHPLMIHGRDGCRWRYVSWPNDCGCTVSNLTTKPQPAPDRSWVSTEQIREQP